jgi:hypothetical protein
VATGLDGSAFKEYPACLGLGDTTASGAEGEWCDRHKGFLIKRVSRRGKRLQEK